MGAKDSVAISKIVTHQKQEAKEIVTVIYSIEEEVVSLSNSPFCSKLRVAAQINDQL